ncbi:MAG: toll/interleukin-1 receptor domain-containing protein [Bauldia sp.]
MARAARPRRRRTDKELLIDKLTELSEGGQQLVSNQAVRDELRWDEDKYYRIREQLMREQLLIFGRGRGGMVGLRNQPDLPALKVFVSYSRVDELGKDGLLKHLRPLTRMKLIETWNDAQILAGEDWGNRISEELERADIILLLISIDFINSEYCYGIEMERAIERHQTGGARLIPVIYRPCIWGHAPFASIQALPKDAKPITSWMSSDEGFASVAQGVKAVAEELLSAR